MQSNPIERISVKAGFKAASCYLAARLFEENATWYGLREIFGGFRE